MNITKDKEDNNNMSLIITIKDSIKIKMIKCQKESLNTHISLKIIKEYKTNLIINTKDNLTTTIIKIIIEDSLNLSQFITINHLHPQVDTEL